MDRQSWYIGYTDFEAFLKKADLYSPIYLMSVQRERPIYEGRLVQESHTITMQVINGVGVHYYQFLTCVFDRVVDAPELMPVQKQKRQASADCCRLIRAWLNKAGFKTVEATVATPKDYVFLEAQMPFCLTFHKERWQFSLREDESEGGAADADQ